MIFSEIFYFIGRSPFGSRLQKGEFPNGHRFSITQIPSHFIQTYDRLKRGVVKNVLVFFQGYIQIKL
jgi:hypothetical protein